MEQVCKRLKVTHLADSPVRSRKRKAGDMLLTPCLKPEKIQKHRLPNSDSPRFDLFQATVMGWTRKITQLLDDEKGDPGLVNRVDQYIGRTPLILAVIVNRPEIVEILLDVPGVDVTIRDDKGYTAQDYADGFAKIAHTFEERSKEKRYQIAAMLAGYVNRGCLPHNKGMLLV